MAAHRGRASLRPRCTRSGSSVAAIPVYQSTPLVSRGVLLFAIRSSTYLLAWRWLHAVETCCLDVLISCCVVLDGFNEYMIISLTSSLIIALLSGRRSHKIESAFVGCSDWSFLWLRALNFVTNHISYFCTAVRGTSKFGCGRQTYFLGLLEMPVVPSFDIPLILTELVVFPSAPTLMTVH
jgi:hypothetical protein